MSLPLPSLMHAGSATFVTEATQDSVKSPNGKIAAPSKYQACLLLL